MFLALREMRRALTRYGLLVVAIALLMFLILFQQALQNGLITSFVGGIRNQSAPVLVFSVDGQRNLQGSLLPPPLEQQIRDADGVGEAALIGQGTFTVRVTDGSGTASDGDSDDGSGDTTDASVLGTDDQAIFAPTTLSEGRRPEAVGEAVGSAADFSIDDRVEVVPAPGADPVTVTVVGLAQDIQINVTPTLFTDFETFEAASTATNPDASAVLPNALAVEPANGVTVDEVVASINEAAPDAEALSRDDAASDSPGVAQVQQSFQLIFLLYALVVPLVTGLFFLIITLQKAGSLTLLRAMGARSAVLANSLLVQVAIVLGGGLLVGIALYYPVSQLEVGGLTLRFDLPTVLIWSAILGVLGFLSAVASLRRVLAIDPIEATTGGGVR